MTETVAKFVTFEGGEGSGKSTNIAYFCDLLRQADIPFVLTREPGGTQIAEKIRDILLAHWEEPLHSLSELLLVFAARAQHIEQVIKPALANQQWVVCDRFTDATYAYQGVARNLGAQYVEQLELLVQGALRPDKTILLDVSVEVGRSRAEARGELDRFEIESVDFFQSVRQAYLSRASNEPSRFSVIDANQAMPTVKAAIKNVFEDLIR